MSEFNNNKILIIIPAWNEARVIGPLLTKLKEQFASADILVVDDCSTDTTRLVAQAHGAMVISFSQNLGYGFALQAGYKIAARNGYDCVLQMDGDGQHSPDSVKNVLAPVLSGTYDIAIGSRALSDVCYPMPTARKIGQKVFSWILYKLCGLRIGDPTSGFQALNRKALSHCITDDFPGDYPDTNMLLYLHLHGVRICEIAAEFRVNQDGTSMHSGILKPMYYIYKMSLSMLLIYWRFKVTQRVNTEQ